MVTKQFLRKQELIADLFYHTKEHNQVACLSRHFVTSVTHPVRSFFTHVNYVTSSVSFVNYIIYVYWLTYLFCYIHALRWMGTGINGLSHTTLRLDYIIANFWSVRNKHFRRSFKMKLALLILTKKTSKERITYRLESCAATYINFYASEQWLCTYVYIRSCKKRLKNSLIYLTKFPIGLI